jgi:hypothetical protein
MPEDTYAADHAWAFDGVHSYIIPAMAALLQLPVSLSKLKRALTDMASGKSPNTDGLTVKFFKYM